MEHLCNHHAALTSVCVGAYSIWECWLGRTKLIKANSTLEIIGLLLLVLWQYEKEAWKIKK